MQHVNSLYAQGQTVDLNVNAQDSQGRTAAMIAAISKNSAPPSVLHAGQGYVLDVFLSSSPFAAGALGMCQDNVIDKSMADHKGHTLMMYGAMTGLWDLVTFKILSRDADSRQTINLQDAQGRTAIILAVQHG